MKKLLLTLALIGFTQAALAEEIKAKFNGQTVNANLVMADGKSYKDKFVLFMHGTLTHKNRSTYIDLQNNLAEQGISSLSFNLSLGINDRDGEYDCATPHTHKHSDALNEIGFWLDWLKKQGADKVNVMAHSRGGSQLAWFANAQDRAQVTSYILWAPATNEQQSAKAYEARYGIALKTNLDKAQALVKAGKGKQIMKDIDFIYCEKAQVTAEAFVDYYAARPEFDSPSMIKNIKKPTLVIIGSEDDVVAELPERIEALGDLAHLSVITIDGADHFFMDLYNEDSAEAVAEFLAN